MVNYSPCSLHKTEKPWTEPNIWQAGAVEDSPQSSVKVFLPKLKYPILLFKYEAYFNSLCQLRYITVLWC